jgi:hypothetical protein
VPTPRVGKPDISSERALAYPHQLDLEEGLTKRPSPRPDGVESNPVLPRQGNVGAHDHCQRVAGYRARRLEGDRYAELRLGRRYEEDSNRGNDC